MKQKITLCGHGYVIHGLPSSNTAQKQVDTTSAEQKPLIRLIFPSGLVLYALSSSRLTHLYLLPNICLVHFPCNHSTEIRPALSLDTIDSVPEMQSVPKGFGYR
jgi:hypothetical protein